MNEIRDLTLLSSAQQALAEARTVDEAKDICDRAAAVRAYVQKARLGRELVIEAATIRIRAERRLGQMLREVPLANAAAGNQYTGPDPEATSNAVRLEDLGITKNESSRSQRIADLADDLFEGYLKECRQAQREPTLSALVRLVAKNSNGKQNSSKQTVVDAVPASANRPEHTAGAAATVLVVLPTHDSEQPDLYQARLVDHLCRWSPGDLIRPDAHLYLWTGGPQLPDALDIMDAWGFAYFGSMACVYRQTRPDVPWCDAHHLLLLGTKGSQPIEEAAPRSWCQCRRPDEGCVPDEVIAVIETASPEPYLWMLGDRAAAPDGWGTVHDPSQLGLKS